MDASANFKQISNEDVDSIEIQPYFKACRIVYQKVESSALEHDRSLTHRDGTSGTLDVDVDDSAAPHVENAVHAAEAAVVDAAKDAMFEAPMDMGDTDLIQEVQDVLDIYKYVNVLRACRAAYSECNTIPVINNKTPCSILDLLYAGMVADASAKHEALRSMTSAMRQQT